MHPNRITLGAALLSALMLSACAPAATTRPAATHTAATPPGTVESGPGLHAVFLNPAPTAAPAAAPLISATGQPIQMALTPTFQDQPGDVFPGLEEVGPFGLWLLSADRTRAAYAPTAGRAQAVRRPMNVVLVDKFAATPDTATTRVTAALGAAGYAAQPGQSAPYQAFAAGEFRTAWPQVYASAGQRLHLFGPWKTAGGFVFAAAVATENTGGAFQDFMVAREALADALNGKTTFRKKGYVDLLGKVETPTETTADHDGCAVVLVARE